MFEKKAFPPPTMALKQRNALVQRIIKVVTINYLYTCYIYSNLPHEYTL